MYLVSHKLWKKIKAFLPQNSSAESENPVFLQRMKLCFGEVRERCSVLDKRKHGKNFAFAGAEEDPGWSSSWRGGDDVMPA